MYISKTLQIIFVLKVFNDQSNVKIKLVLNKIYSYLSNICKLVGIVENLMGHFIAN